MSKPKLRERQLPDGGGAAYLETLAAYGEVRGVSRAAASKWNKAGQIVFVPDDEGRKKTGLIDVAASDAKRNADQNPVKRQAPSPTVTETNDDAAPKKPSDPTLDAVTQAKAGSAVLDLKLKRLNYEEKVGNLVPKSEMEERNAGRGHRMAEALMRLAGDVAEDANPDDPNRARKVISAAVRTLLERFIEGETERLDAEAELDTAPQTEMAEVVHA